ncbi:mycothiol synthase [Salana multivorans]
MTRDELMDVDRAQVRDLLAAATAHDGVEPLSEEHLLALRRPGARAWLAREEAGPVVGIASRAGQAVEVAVHPAHRRRGHGRALLAASLGLGGSQPASAGPDDAGGPAVWAHGDLPPARALAAGLGLERTRELLRLEKELGPQDVTLPRLPGVVALADLAPPERPTALAAWLDLNAVAFADHPEQGRWTEEDVAARTAEPWFDPAVLYLVLREGPLTPQEEPPDATGRAPWYRRKGPLDGGLAASLWVKTEPSDSGQAEIYVLAVHPDAAGRGLGRGLLTHALGELARGGTRTVDLYVDGGNERAVRLYEGIGFTVVERHSQYTPTPS